MGYMSQDEKSTKPWKVDDPFLLADLQRRFKEKMDRYIYNPPSMPLIRQHFKSKDLIAVNKESTDE